MQHWRMKALVISCVALASVTCHALTLTEAYDLALMNDPTYRSALKDFESGAANKNIGLSALMPKLSANYYYYQNDTMQWTKGASASATQSKYPSENGSLQLTMPLFSMDAIARYRQGQSQANFSEEKFKYNAQDLLIRVTQAYLDTLFAQDSLKFQMTERDALLEQSKLMEKFFVNGESSKTDVLEALAAYRVSMSKIIDIEYTLENNRRKLVDIIGYPADSKEITPLDRQFQALPIKFRSFTEWRDVTMLNSPQIKAQAFQTEVALREYEKAVAGRYPVVNLVGTLSSQTSSTLTSIGIGYNQNYIGVQVSVPIYTGGESDARIAQTYASYEKAKADFDANRDQTITELKKQYDIVQSSLEKINAVSLAVDSTVALVKAMQKSVQFGERANVDLLNAQKSLSNNNRDLAQAKYNYLIAFLKLGQLSGTLDLDRFQQITKYFEDPTRPPVRIAVFKKEEPSDNKFNIVENFDQAGKVAQYGVAPAVASTIDMPPSQKPASAYKSLVTIESLKDSSKESPVTPAPSSKTSLAKPELAPSVPVVTTVAPSAKPAVSKASTAKTTLLKPPAPDPEIANLVYVPEPVKYRMLASDPAPTPNAPPALPISPKSSKYSSVKSLQETSVVDKVTPSFEEVKPIKPAFKKTIDIIPIDQIP